MEDFKLENFKRAHDGRAFPSFRHLSEVEAETLRERLATAANVTHSSDLLQFTRAVSARTMPTGLWATDDSFDLDATLRTLGVHPRARVLVNWYRFDDVDEISLADLTLYFDDVWYHGADDMDVFDTTCGWIISIRHDGHIGYAKFSNSSPSVGGGSHD